MLKRKLFALVLSSALGLAAASSQAAIITSSDIVPVPVGTVGSGNGTLDLLLFTESSGGSTNSSGPFNGDNANTDMPTGNGKPTANESYITSIGDLRSFFILNFPNGSGGSTVNQLIVMVDVNETGGPQTIELGTFEIIRNFSSFSPGSDTRNNPASNDITSSVQNETNGTFSGGTSLASLDSSKTLGQVSIGAGHADQAIFTGINPFDAGYAATDRILFHWASSDHDNGGETIFLSGEIGPGDLSSTVPEPTGLALLAGASLLMARRRCA